MALALYRDVAAAYIQAARDKQPGLCVVLTTGCFDVLGPHHIALLREAATLGDLLVVGINCDRRIQELKGPGRPTRPVAERALIMAGIEGVDLVTWFPEDTPAELIEMLRPDVFVKGGDYRGADLPEREAVERNGGRVEFISVEGAVNTSAMLDGYFQARSAALAEAP